MSWDIGNIKVCTYCFWVIVNDNCFNTHFAKALDMYFAYGRAPVDCTI